MKKQPLWVGVLVAMLGLMACSSGGGSEAPAPATGGRTYTMTITMDVAASEKMVTLSDLNAPIQQVVNTLNWLSTVTQPYTSGAPQLKLVVTENPNTSSRQGEITIHAYSGDEVKLTVTQKGKQAPPPDDGDDDEEGTSIEDTHNSVTDQPAYAPVR